MKKLYISFISLFLCAIMAFGVYTFAVPGKGFSENENRYLAKKPELSLSAVMDGSFQKELSEYMSDRFILRDRLMKFSTDVKKAEGKKDYGDVYRGKDGYYFEKITDNEIDLSQFKKNLNWINAFAMAHSNSVTVMLVPSSGTINNSRLPKFAEYYNSDSMFALAKTKLEHCNFVDVQNEMMAASLQLYYKTDHHWTDFGANIGYKKLCQCMNINYIAQSNYKASDSFYGTLFSKTLDSATKPDSLYLPKIKNYTAVADGKKISVFQKDELQSKDKYKVFFGGNYGTVRIKTDCETPKKLVIFKDSFANSLVPYLTQNYQEITMVDYRFYNNSAESIVTDSDTDILFLYEMSNFANDKDIMKIQLFN